MFPNIESDAVRAVEIRFGHDDQPSTAEANLTDGEISGLHLPEVLSAAAVLGIDLPSSVGWYVRPFRSRAARHLQGASAQLAAFLALVSRRAPAGSRLRFKLPEGAEIWATGRVAVSGGRVRVLPTSLADGGRQPKILSEKLREFERSPAEIMLCAAADCARVRTLAHRLGLRFDDLAAICDDRRRAFSKLLLAVRPDGLSVIREQLFDMPARPPPVPSAEFE